MRKKLLSILVAIVCIFSIFCGLVACSDIANEEQNNNKNQSGNISTNEKPALFTKEYTSDLELISDLKKISNLEYYYEGLGSKENKEIIGNLKNNSTALEFFNDNSMGGFCQKLYDSGFPKVRIVELYRSLSKLKRADIYRIPIKVSEHYEPFLVLSGLLDQSKFESTIKSVLKNPESLQIHSVRMCLNTGELEENNRFNGSDINFYADISAQNSFGGYTRSYCKIATKFYDDEPFGYIIYYSETLEYYAYNNAIKESDYSKLLFYNN